MIKKNILALDASTKRTGYAIACKDNTYACGALASTSTRLEKRLTVMRDGIKKLIEDYNIEQIIIEDVRPDNTNIHTAKVLTWLQGLIAVAAFEVDPNIKFEMIGTSSWRSIIGLQKHCVKREDQKQMDIEYANKCGFPLDAPLTATQDDEADAICILNAFLIQQTKTSTSEKESAF